MALTDLAARKLKATDKRQEIAQGDIPGLALIINPPSTKHPTGAKTWVLRYRVGGKSVKYTIGALSKFTVGKAKEVAKKPPRRHGRGFARRSRPGGSSGTSQK